MFKSDFIELPEDVFYPDEKQKKEFEKVMNKLSEAVFDFGEYIKKVAPPNITIYEATREPNFTHSFGIFLDCSIMNDKMQKNFQKDIEDKEKKK
jgi:hypothetical protein